MAEATTPRELPSLEELDLADYQLGSFISELSDFLFVLERAGDPPGGHPKTPEEYLERSAAGDTFETPQLDRNRLAAIVVFASEVIRDGEFIKSEATKLRDEALALYVGQTRGADKQRVREW